MAERSLHFLLCNSSTGERRPPPCHPPPFLCAQTVSARNPFHASLTHRVVATLLTLLCPFTAHSENPPLQITAAPAPPPPRTARSPLSPAAPTKAQERYRQHLERNPSEGLALDRLWQGYAEAGLSQTLLAEYQRPPETPERQFLLGLLLQKAGRPEDALAALLNAAKPDSPPAPPHAGPAHPLTKPALLAAAKLQRTRQHPLEAAHLLERALANSASSPLGAKPNGETELLLELGAAWQAAGHGESAARAWEKAVLLDPQNLDLRRKIVDVYLGQQLGDRALPHLEYLRARSGPEGKVQALQLTARVHQNAGRSQEAIAALEEALAATGPTSWMRSELQSQFIRLHQRLHKTEDLEARWLEYVRANPRDLTAHLQLLDLYERLGEQEHQLEWLSKLCSLAPDRPQYQLRLARLQTHMDLLPEAAATYDQLIARPKPDPETVLERARIELLLEAPDQARTRIQNLLTQNSGDEGVRSRILDFLQTHRLDDLLENELTLNAKSGKAEAVSALASFLFSIRQVDRARDTLARLVPEGAPPAQQAAARMRIAQILRENGQTPAARAELEAALRLQPDARDALLALADLEQARENRTAAREALERVFLLSQTPAERLEADQKIFDLLRSTPTTQNRSEPEMADQLLRLTRAAAEKPSPESWLRIARWQFWNRSLRIAQECAQRALNLDPQGVEAREFLVRLAASEGQVPLAATHLEALADADPVRRTEFQRRLAQIQLDAGQTADALRSYAELAAAQPGNLQALEDLGAAQQRAELWKEALDTWQKAELLAPALRRREIQKILFRLQERLGLHQEAARMLLAEVDSLAGERGDDRARNSALQELIAHCSKHGLLQWIQEEFERRKREKGEDTFTETALGRICKAQGDKNRAFELLSEAALVAPNQAEALPELVREAEELRKLPAAVKLQGLLVRASPQWQPAPLEKLAQLQEKDGDLNEAGKTWSRLATRFPRDSAVLQHAADFELRWGTPEKAVEFLRRLVTLEPNQIQALASLARLELQAGNREAARVCLEAVLRHTPAEHRGVSLQIPGRRTVPPGRIQNAYLSATRLRETAPNNDTLRALRAFWIESGSKPQAPLGDAGLRLDAIALLARLASTVPLEREAWIHRWQALSGEQPGEALAAFYYAGASGPLLNTLASLEEDPQSAPMARLAFPWAALQFRCWDRLKAWTEHPSRSAEDRDCLAIAFSELLQERPPEIPPEVLEQLFPSDFRLWQAATALGQNGRLAEAVTLAERLLQRPAPTGAPPPLRPGYRLEVARWNLALGRRDTAIKLLEEAVRAPGDSPDSPAFEALYERLLLVPEPERPAVAHRLLEGELGGVHRHLVWILCHGMSGVPDLARKELAGLLALKAVPTLDDPEPADAASRHWAFLGRAGTRLQEWGLSGLAADLWGTALSDPALIALQRSEGNDLIQSRVFEVRNHLAALKSMEALRQQPVLLPELFRKHRQQTGAEGLVQLAELLESKGAHRPAIQILRMFLEAEPDNPHAQRSFAQACRAGHDLESLREGLPEFFPPFAAAQKNGAKPSFPSRELLLLVADFFEDLGKPEQSVALLVHAASEGLNDSRLQIRLAQAHLRCQKPAEAESLYREVLRKDPSNGTARLGLAALLKLVQRPKEAAALLEGSALPEAEMQLVELYGLSDQPDEAQAALDRLPAHAQIQPAIALATLLQKGNNPSAARRLLRNTLSRASTSADAFAVQSAFLRLPNSASDSREWSRLRHIAGEDPDLQEALILLQIEIPVPEPAASERIHEWTRKWEKGMAAAGAALLQNALRRQSPEADALAAQILSREDLSDRLLQHLLEHTPEAPGIHLKFLEKKAARNPLDSAPALSLASALEKNGFPQEAARVLESLGLQSGFQPDIPGKIAPGLARLEHRTTARHFFQLAVQNDPGVQHFETFIEYAKFLLKEGHPGRALKTLRSAFQNPRNRSYTEILSFLDTTQKGQSPESLARELGPFWLPSGALQTLKDLKSASVPARNTP